MVNRHASPARLPLNRGNRTFGPLRLPFLLSSQFLSATERFARPDAYASFEFSAHHGAASPFAVFQSLRSEYADHEIFGVISSAGMLYEDSGLPLQHQAERCQPQQRIALPVQPEIHRA